MQDLNKFKNEMNLSGQNVYVGHRYVPKIMGDWDNTQQYEPLSIVQYQGNSFTSRQYVPSGIEITNEEYWASTGNYNAQVELYRQQVNTLANDLDNKADNAQLEEVKEGLSELVLNVKSFGAFGDGKSHKLSSVYATLDEAKIDYPQAISLDDQFDYVAIKKALDEAVKYTKGNSVYLPAGVYKLNRTLEITPSHITDRPVSKTNFYGTNYEASVLDFSLAESGDGLLVSGIYTDIHDFRVQNAKGHGFTFDSGNNLSIYNLSLNRLRSEQNGGDGFHFEKAFMVDINHCYAFNNGGYGINLTGTHTSINVENCYSHSNTLGGYYAKDMNYSNFSGNAADFGLIGYTFDNVQGVSFNGNGAESVNNALYITGAQTVLNIDGLRTFTIEEDTIVIDEDLFFGFISIKGARDSNVNNPTSTYYLNIKDTRNAQNIQLIHLLDDERSRARQVTGTNAKMVYTYKSIMQQYDVVTTKAKFLINGTDEHIVYNNVDPNFFRFKQYGGLMYIQCNMTITSWTGASEGDIDIEFPSELPNVLGNPIITIQDHNRINVPRMYARISTTSGVTKAKLYVVNADNTSRRLKGTDLTTQNFRIEFSGVYSVFETR